MNRKPIALAHGTTGLEGCRFPLWGNKERAPRPPLFCGKPAPLGSSWCSECAERVFLPPPIFQPQQHHHLQHERRAA